MITPRDIETLGELAAANRNHTDLGFLNGWARPLDCGGSNGSHHGATLAKLHREGLADRRGYRPGSRHVWLYKITRLGLNLLALRRK